MTQHRDVKYVACDVLVQPWWVMLLTTSTALPDRLRPSDLLPHVLLGTQLELINRRVHCYVGPPPRVLELRFSAVQWQLRGWQAQVPAGTDLRDIARAVALMIGNDESRALVQLFPIDQVLRNDLDPQDPRVTLTPPLQVMWTGGRVAHETD